MRTAIAADNPFGHTRYGYLWEQLRRRGGSTRHLDVGSFDGAVPATLITSGVASSAFAADVVDGESLYRAAAGEPPEGLEFLRLQVGDAWRLPLPDGSIASASLLDVIEHVADQRRVLEEVWRCLEPAGILIITVPRQHVFSALDTGNWKFRFPALHRSFIEWRHSPDYYKRRYGAPESGLVGDIERAKSWHEHFTENRLQALLTSGGFRLLDVDAAGLLARPLAIAKLVSPEPVRRRIARLIDRDAARFSRTHLFMTAAKVPKPPRPAG